MNMHATPSANTAELDTGAISSVLVVDDDPLLLGIMEAYLTKIGVAETVTAEDGAAALLAVDDTAREFDLICCDLNMPNLDGIAFLSRLAERCFSGGVMIISSEHDAIRRTAEDFASEAGLNVLGSLKKPFDPKQFDSLTTRRQRRRTMSTKTGLDDFEPDVLFAPDSGIVPYFQPQLCARSGAVRGVEALARLRLPDDSLLGPHQFFGSIEQHGLWAAVFDRMFDLAVSELSDWLRDGHDLSVSINIDARTLCDTGLPDRIRAKARQAGVETTHITLELTEDEALTSTARMLEIVGRLRLFGFKLSIDDFGKGYSNFERLQRMPFTELKIDRQFINATLHDPVAAACVTSSVALARAGGFKTVAEGVETNDERNFVREAGVDLIQGFFYSEPLSANAFRRFAQASAKGATASI